MNLPFFLLKNSYRCLILLNILVNIDESLYCVQELEQSDSECLFLVTFNLRTMDFTKVSSLKLNTFVITNFYISLTLQYCTELLVGTQILQSIIKLFGTRTRSPFCRHGLAPLSTLMCYPWCSQSTQSKWVSTNIHIQYRKLVRPHEISRARKLYDDSV